MVQDAAGRGVRISAKSISLQIFVIAALFAVGFALSTGILSGVYHTLAGKFVDDIEESIFHHTLTLVSREDVRHYFLFPEGEYAGWIFAQPPSVAVFASVFFYSIFNMLFQPVFLCVFTPQVILNVVAFPFFLYGSVRYFRKVWPLLLSFVLITFRIGIYDSSVEALMRHGMICELFYLMIGSAGFAGWIAKRS